MKHIVEPSDFIIRECPKCGRKTIHYPWEIFIECDCDQKLVRDDNNRGMGYGWICPVCGRGLSPLTTVCPCGPKYKSITSSTTGEREEQGTWQRSENG